MITFFSIPKPFVEHTGIIQANAIESWMKVKNSKVILFGKEEGIENYLERDNLTIHSDIAINSHGTPMVSDAFLKAKRLSNQKNLCYLNADILIDNSIIDCLKILQESSLTEWFLSARRVDCDIKETLKKDWLKTLIIDFKKTGNLHGPAGMDLFLFPRDLEITLPPFAVGRPGWDSWLVYHVRSKRIPFIDATSNLNVIHQNHPPAYKRKGQESLENKRSAKSYFHMGTLRDADWKITNTLELKKRYRGNLFFNPVLRFLFALKRHLGL